MGTFRETLLEGQVAFVTGGGTGIGREIARAIGRHGGKVAIASRKRDVLDEAAADLREEGIEVFVGECDVRKPDQIESVVAGIVDRFGRIDVLVNNAAGNFPAFMDNISYNGFKSIVDIDLTGTYNVSKAVYEAWMKANGGRIVNITAPFDGMGVSLQAHVAAAKMGVDSLTRSCAVEWGPRGIRVNAIAPGEIEATEGVARFEQATDATGGRNPLGHAGSRDDIANAVLFFVSDAARFVTGQVLSVDGAGSIDMLKIRPG